MDIQQLLLELETGNDRQRRAASYKLSKLKDPSTVPQLVRAYDDNDPVVHGNVAQALRAIGTQDALNCLQEHQEHEVADRRRLTRQCKRYALGKDAPKWCLDISWGPDDPDIKFTVSLDGNIIGTISEVRELIAGQRFHLPDGSSLGVKAKARKSADLSVVRYVLEVMRGGRLLRGEVKKPQLFISVGSLVLAALWVILQPFILPSLSRDGAECLTVTLIASALFVGVPLGIAALSPLLPSTVFSIVEAYVGCQTGATRQWTTSNGQIRTEHESTPYSLTHFQLIHGARKPLTIQCSNCQRNITIGEDHSGSTGAAALVMVKRICDPGNHAGYPHAIIAYPKTGRKPME